MNFFNTGLFWFIEGILACMVVIGIKTWAEDRGIPLPFWKWILFGFWFLFYGFTIAFVGTSIGENEMVAATKGGIIFGIITIISGVGLWRLIKIKNK